MIGSAAIAGWIAHGAFWSVLGWGWATGDLQPRIALLFIAACFAGLAALRYLALGAMFPSFVALLDIALVLIVFKGDIRIG